MAPYVEQVIQRLWDAKRDLALDVEAKQQRFHYRVRRGHIWFDNEVQRAHRRLRQSIPSYIRHGSVLSLLTAPVIYSLLIPLAILDAWVWAYQRICFPIYGISRVPRRAYFVMDRRRLAYLNGIERVNCTYCSYANGLFAYVSEVAARTEQYWCPIRHARAIRAPHRRYHAFFEYGDAEGYRKGLKRVRRRLPHRGAHGQRPKGLKRPAVLHVDEES